MKTKITYLITMLLCTSSVVFGQPVRVNTAYDLHYDLLTKRWSGAAFHNKYFIVPYKTQQTVIVENVPSGFTVEVEETAIFVTPDTVSFAAIQGLLPNSDVVYLSKVIESDEMEYTVTVKDADDKVVHSSVVFVKVFGGLKIDLSTGVVFHSLADNKYHYEQTGTDFTLRKDKKDSKTFPISPVILTHAYFRSKGFFKLGSTLGLGINDNGKVGYYLGVAGLIGDRQRIIVSAGAAFRPVKTLKGQYETGQAFSGADKPEEDDLTEDKYQTGFFFSLSYNLTSKVERK